MNDLEKFVGDLARGQIPRRAPGSLERRVLAQVTLRQLDMPWWRRGFIHWPLGAQAVFLLASVGFVWLGIDAASVTASAASFVWHAVPSEWLYAVAAAGFMLYALLFGLGAVAYRTLYAER